MHLVHHFSKARIVEELLITLFQPAICRADNVFVVSKFASFHEFLQFREADNSQNLLNMVGNEVVLLSISDGRSA